MESTTYQERRYFVPSSLLAPQAMKRQDQARKKSVKPKPLTYAAMLERQDYLVQQGQVNKQTAANRATALRIFLEQHRLAPDDVVGAEMRSGFESAVAALATTLREKGKSSRSITNTRAALTPWRKAVAADDHQRALIEGEAVPFQRAVAEMVGSHPIKTVARQSGVPAAMLRGWIKGQVPRGSNAKFIRRLEAYYGLERETLVRLAGIDGNSRPHAGVGQARPIEYRKRLGRQRGAKYYVEVSEDSPLREQWRALVEYKTAAAPVLKRHKRGTWTPSQHPPRTPRTREWYAYLDGHKVSSASKCWADIASYLGWLTLAVEKGGLGMPLETVQTLAWLAVPDHVDAYLRWRIARCDNRLTKNVLHFLNVVAWMVRPGDGYLFQQPHLQETLPEKHRVMPWEQLCTRQLDYAERLRDFWDSRTQVSRNSFEPVRAVIESGSPLDEIADMVHRMRNDRPLDNPVDEAIWARDIFLIKLLASNPLRRNNIIHLTWHESFVGGHHADNRECLYQKPDGSWWFYVPRGLMKTRKNEAYGDYDAPVHAVVWKDLERYLFKHRPVLMRWPTDLVFLTKTLDPEKELSSKGQAYKQTRPSEHLPYEAIGNHVAKLTARYLRDCPGARMHAFRNIVGTAVLKADGGDIKTAARVLHDRETTVEKHYAWLSSGDASKHMGQLLDSSFSRM